MEQDWNRKAGAVTLTCIRCGVNPPAPARRRCKSCLAEQERERRERLLQVGDGRPCATADCEAPRYKLNSQFSSYCYDHHLLIRRKGAMKWTYGLDFADYEKLIAKAHGRCEICGGTKKLCVDHDHGTGEIRGILCDACNSSLGKFGDDPDRLLAAAGYLLRSRDVLPR